MGGGQSSTAQSGRCGVRTSFMATERDLSTNLCVSGHSASPYSVRFTGVADHAPFTTPTTRRAVMHAVAVLMIH